MKLSRTVYQIATLLAFIGNPCFSQGSSTFNLEAYQQFLSAHRDISSGELASLHDAGRFTARLSLDFSTATYFDSIDAYYRLTTDERSLLRNHGFVVTERLQRNSFGEAFLEIYKRDLPVFVSTDAILHALHMSWDAILMEVEKTILTRKLDSLLARLHGQLPALAARYSSVPPLETMLNDVDIYLTVPRMLLGTATGPEFSENAGTVQKLLALIKAERPSLYKLFSDNERTIDFSQFTVRGHYTQSVELSRYFQAMIWLGRTEIYLIAPESDEVT